MELQPTPAIKRAASVSSWVTPGRPSSLRPGSAGSKRRHGPFGRDAPPFQPYEMGRRWGWPSCVSLLACQLVVARTNQSPASPARSRSTQEHPATRQKSQVPCTKQMSLAIANSALRILPRAKSGSMPARSGRPSPSHQLAWTTCLEPRQSGKQVAPAAQLKLVAQTGCWISLERRRPRGVGQAACQAAAIVAVTEQPRRTV
jgi:hypothetical protein